MRRILIDRARRKQRPKHGGHLRQTEFDELDINITAGAADGHLLEVDELLDQLAEEDPAKAEVVKLKFFVGLSNADAAAEARAAPSMMLEATRVKSFKRWMYSPA